MFSCFYAFLILNKFIKYHLPFYFSLIFLYKDSIFLMRRIYSIEGNIGSGKSTFLNLIKQSFTNVQVIQEPVSQWQHISNRFNLLQQYYKDPKRWAFTFQVNAILSRMKSLAKLLSQADRAQKKQTIFFSQRSIYADRQIFAKLLAEQRKMNAMEHALYLNMFDSLENLFQSPRIHKFIYLKTTPEKCFERMLKRARTEEVSIDLDYFVSLHLFHQTWLSKHSGTLVIDGQQEFQSNPQRASQMIEEVKKFIVQ